MTENDHTLLKMTTTPNMALSSKPLGLHNFWDAQNVKNTNVYEDVCNVLDLDFLWQNN